MITAGKTFAALFTGAEWKVQKKVGREKEVSAPLGIAADTGLWLMQVQYERIARAKGNGQRFADNKEKKIFNQVCDLAVNLCTKKRAILSASLVIAISCLIFWG